MAIGLLKAKTGPNETTVIYPQTTIDAVSGLRDELASLGGGDSRGYNSHKKSTNRHY